MKYVSYLDPDGITAGVLMGDQVIPLRDGAAVDWSGQPIGLLQHIASGAAPDVVDDAARPVADVELVAPIPVPRRNIFCVGQNYAEHSAEFDASGFNATASNGIPDRPVIFTKAPSTVIGPGVDIPSHSGLTEKLDYEAELAVIIGRGGVGISVENALTHVWGYTIVNDVTARDLQHSHRQWFLGKSLDGNCPMGPYVVSADEIDHRDLLVESRVNGELRQSAKTTDLIFDIPELIATISRGITLLPGDIIATGTPLGVGIGFKPPRFLRPGDRVDITISGLGMLTNTVAAGT